MTRAHSLIGNVYGRLTVKSRLPSDKRGQSMWLCQCACGNEHAIRGAGLIHSGTRSCGCLKDEATRERETTHGMTKSPEYRIWAAMLQRCNNPKNRRYADWGGRGITVCERWHDFANFISDLGLRPTPKHSIDRFPDNNGNYEPGNCRWATMREQNQNRRDTANETKSRRTA